MTLREWLRKFHTRPQMIVAIFLLGVWCIFAVRSYLVIEKKHSTYVKQTSDLLSIAFMQSNRIMAESVMEILVSQGGASSAEVCENGKQIIGTNLILQSCTKNDSFLERIIEEKVVGSSSQVLRARFKVAEDLMSLVSGLGISLFLVFSGFYFIQSTKDKIKSDIFEPLLKKLLGSEKLEIKELNELRQEIIRAQELEAQKAVMLAIQENNQQVAHDIRSPIQSINALLSMVEIQDSAVKAALEKSVKRANSVANFLLSEEKATDLEKSETCYDLAMVVDDIVIEKSPLFTGGKIILNSPKYFRTQSTLSAESISRILSNVVDNAIQACGDKKIIEITLRQFQKNAEILVRDSGCGIAPEVLNRIGEKGFSKRIRGQSSGSGRGVYSAKLALQEIGGNIQFTSSPGVGTNVSIQIPACSIECSDRADLILIDNEEMHRLNWKIWAEKSGHSLHTFSNPDHFLKDSARYEKSVPVFLDFNLDSGKTAEAFLPAIIKNGFQNVILATAQESLRADQFIGVKDVVGKDPRHSEKFLVRKFDFEVGI